MDRGLYADPAFQSLILRLLLAPPARSDDLSRPEAGVPEAPGQTRPIASLRPPWPQD